MGDDRSLDNGSESGSRLDDLFAVFANYRRRYVLHYLREEGRASIGGIARQLAAWERASRSEMVSGELIDRIELELFHTHLPRLREVNLVEYDQRTSVVVYRDPPEIVRALLDLCTDRDLPN